MSDVIIRDKAEYHTRTTEQMERHLAVPTWSLRQKIARMPAPPRPRLRLPDYVGALAVMLIVFLSTFPLVIAFLFVGETLRAMRLSNIIALIMLAILGYRLGRYGAYQPILTALSMVGIGVSLVLITMALGG